MTPDRPDDELATAAAAGDAGAFAALAERHRTGLIRSAALLTGDPDEAESIAQEALARAFAGLAGYRPETPFFAWVRGFVLNLARQHLRRVGRHAKPTDPQHLAPAADPAGRTNGVLSGILRDERSDHVWRAVAALPEAYREAVVLRYVDGLDYDQMAAITGASAGALRVRALRARGLLRGELGSVVDTWMRGKPDEPA